MSDFYVLNGHEVVPVDMETWGAFIQNRQNRLVKQEDAIDGVNVSTVFLGMDQGHGGGPPELFETMVFGGPHDKYCERYTTWDQAEAGHRVIVQAVKDGTLK